MSTPPGDETNFFVDFKQPDNPRLVPIEEKPSVRDSDIVQTETELRNQKATSSAFTSTTKEETEKTIEPLSEYTLKTTIETFRKEILINSEQETITLPGPKVSFPPLFNSIKTQFVKSASNSDEDWELSQSDKMAMPIRDVTRLIPEYDGKEKTLDSFIKKIDKLWTYIAEFDDNDRTQFLLVLQLKLVDKAAEAVQDNEFEDWEAVKTDLIEHITPHRNTEKSELKLCTIKQKFEEDVETYAKRIEDALDTLNRSFSQEDQNETIKKENDRKARKTFENGLNDSRLRNKAISRASNTLKEAVDYVIEQELRYSELKPTLSPNFCTYCKRPGHTLSECRTRKSPSDYRNAYDKNRNSHGENGKVEPNQTTPRANVICFKCNCHGHYANTCTVPTPSTYNANQGATRQFRSHDSPPKNDPQEMFAPDQVEIENISTKN